MSKLYFVFKVYFNQNWISDKTLNSWCLHCHCSWAFFIPKRWKIVMFHSAHSWFTVIAPPSQLFSFPTLKPYGSSQARRKTPRWWSENDQFIQKMTQQILRNWGQALICIFKYAPFDFQQQAVCLVNHHRRAAEGAAETPTCLFLPSQL